MSDPAAPVPRVSIIVISYNTKAMTLDCLRSIAAETTVPHEVILLDNDSPDGSAAAITAAFPEVRLIASAENHGFAKGNNIAAGYARGDYLLLLNPDTVVLDQAIDRLVAFAERTPAAGIWGGRTLYGDGSLNPTNCFAFQSLWSIFCITTGLSQLLRRSEWFNLEVYGDWDRSTEREVGYVSGAFFLIKRAFWSQLGGFDLTFVMYGEETDLTHRARKVGARPRMTPNATIIHYVGASSNRRSNKDALIMKSKVTLALRYLPNWQRPPAMFFLRIRPLTRMFGGRLIAWLTGSADAADAARHWSEVWESRGTWQEGFPKIKPSPAAGTTFLPPIQEISNVR